MAKKPQQPGFQHPQLPLHFVRPELFTFENYQVDENHTVMAMLEAQFSKGGERRLYLWGEGVGITHLLCAACDAADKQGKRSIYLPMGELITESPGLLEGAEALDLVCLDEIDVVAQDQDWQIALFHFLNRAQEQGAALVIGASKPPKLLGIGLPDLESRLAACLVLQVKALSEDGKRQLIKKRALASGLFLSDEVVTYLMNRSERDTKTLVRFVEEIDRASLASGRKITVPFVRETMGW